MPSRIHRAKLGPLPDQVSGRPFTDMWAAGDLGSLTAPYDLDFRVSRIARTLKALVIAVGDTPASGTVQFDLLLNGVSMFPTQAKPEVTCSGGLATVTLEGAALETTAIAAGDALVLRLLSAPAGAIDVRADLYD